ncbi:MAG: UvrD-helicase domain-containing protein [bacterium]|nr:UvrD-helicase domain-containing protein [bacterium]
MRFITDFHIHSKYSLATSKFADIPNLDYWAKLKGVQVLGTGDCIHPKYLEEIKTQLEYNDNGLFTVKKNFKIANAPKKLDKPTHFMLTTEISNIYKKNGKTRKVHNLCILPTIEAADKLQKKLDKIGNIASDGRPILGLDSKILLEIVLETNEKSFLIPAHIWTPWFSVLGSKSGFDNIEECYEDLTPEIFALETGLSSDPPMNWACSFLDNFRLISNSDAHSPEKIGREANIFDCEKSYNGIYNALKYDTGFIGTIEFFPQEGKYYDNGHRKCNICFNPLETIQHQGICPVCNTQLTKGVMYRVAELADRDNVNQAKNKKKFYSITSLPDLVSEITGKGIKSKATQLEYFKILNLIGSDFHTLLFSSLKKIHNKYGYVLAEGIRRIRAAEVNIKHGFDGQFGAIKAFKSPLEITEIQHISLFESDENKIAEKRSQKQKLHFDIKKFQAETNKQKNKKKELIDFSKYIDMTESQKTIINHKDGSMMVIAGPGTGKTSVLVERIAMLVRNGVKDSSILALTFTNKACEEIHERLITKILSFNTNITTFHKLALKIIKNDLKLTARTEGFKIVEKHGSADDNSFDLEQLITEAIHILQLYKNKVAPFPDNKHCFKYILIDEFQDINEAQYKLIKLLLPAKNPNLFVIGDPDQAIYGFRGSDVKFIQELKIDYPTIKTIKLQKSYRCPSNILKMAAQALNKNDCLEGHDFNIKTDITECTSSKSEAIFIAKKIETMLGGLKSLTVSNTQQLQSLASIAILCRTPHLFAPIIEALNKYSIPYKIIGEAPFYKQKKFAKMLEQLNFEELKKVKEFKQLTTKFQNKKALLEAIALRTAIDEYDIKEEAVTIMTMHASKGLEFECVFIPACEESILPFEFFKKKNEYEIKEEERLFYVAATRTKKYLFLSHAKKRFFNHRLLTLAKSSILDRFEKNLIKSLKIKENPQKKQIEFLF